MAQLKFELKSPFIPLFQRGIFLFRTLTPLWKRGEGEIFGGTATEIMWRISETGHKKVAFITEANRGVANQHFTNNNPRN
jgi:hypothetical protein